MLLRRVTIRGAQPSSRPSEEICLSEGSSGVSQGLSGMFRRSASLAILHRKSFAAIPSVSLALLGHTNRSVKLSHESQRQIALV